MFAGIGIIIVAGICIILAKIEPKCPNCKHKFKREFYYPGDPVNVFYECPKCDK